MLRRYERWRKARRCRRSRLDGIKRLFFGGNPLQSRCARRAWLAQSSGMLKRVLQRALGVAGEVPVSVRRPPS